MSEAFGGVYRDRRALVTGHTGFKGSWLSLWLAELGARVAGLALDPPSEPSHFAACGMARHLEDFRCDIRDQARVGAVIDEARPEIVFHLAAQPIVRRAFQDPLETFAVNVMGTANVLEAARRCDSVRAVVVATSDKSYRNVGWDWAYRETDPLGGHEPYGASKACAELVTEVYRQARFQLHAAYPRRFAVASARAGNVIGGGDWAADRLVPDVARAIAAGRDIILRNPDAVRPWQHVLECLSGYLLLGTQLFQDQETEGEAWNFGPRDAEALPAASLVRHLLATWPGHGVQVVVDPDPPGKEAHLLRVDSSKAIHRLGWHPVWPVAEAVARTAAWYQRHAVPGEDMHATSTAQIAAYTQAAREAGNAWAS